MKEEMEDTQENSKSKHKLGVRHIQVLILFIGTVIAFGMRVNMSIAIVAMTDNTKDYYFDWSMQTQSVILSSYFWGYVMLQIPAGEIAARYGGMLMMTLCVAVNSAVSLLLPVCLYYGGWQLLCACRVVQGLFQGFLFPSVHNLIGKWIPVEETSLLATIIYAGAQLGIALQLMTSGFIVEAWGWPAIFYVNGTLGVIWTVIYIILGAATPQTSRMISNEEKLMIQSSLGHVGGHKKLKTPWKSLGTSMPFFALNIASCGFNWGYWTLLTEIPTYMNKVLGVDIQANGLISAMPYLAMYAMSFLFGYLSHYVAKKNIMSITASRKVSNSIGNFGQAIAMLGLAYVPAGNNTLAIILLILAVSVNAGSYTGFLLVHLDMAPNFAGTMMGITNSVSHVVSIIAPLVAGAILKDETDPDDWRKVFFISAAIFVACNLFYIIFGSSETQKWNEPEDACENDAPEKQS